MQTAHVPGDEVELLGGGDVLFPRMLAAVENARQQIHLEVYTWAMDSVGSRFVVALEAAARRKLNVRVILDGFGSMEDSAEIAARLRDAGCEVTVFNPLSAWLRGRLLRNHRKLLLIDDVQVFIGGINIAEAYASSGPQPGWADLAVEVRGGACLALARRLRGEEGVEAPDSNVRILLSVFGGGRRLQRRYIQALQRARRQAYLAQAYFLPDQALIRALVRAARRGVEVNLVLAGRSDVPFARAATMRLYRQLLTGGVRIFEWTESVLHAKAAAIDDDLLLVGSFNLDPLSLVNLEALVEVHNHQVTTNGRRWIESRAAYSRQVTLQDCRRSPVQAFFTDIIGLWAARLADQWVRWAMPKRRPPLPH